MLLTFLYSLVADHYQYLACIGPLTLAAAAITNGFSFFGETKQLFLKPFVCGGILLLFGALTWRQCAMYSDEETLWRTTIAKNPSSWMARNNLGGLLLKERRFDEALGQYREILQMLPNDPYAHNNLAAALLRKGDVDQAITEFREVLRLQPSDPRVRFNLGSALLRKGDLDEAILHLEKALELRSDATDKARRNADVHFNLGNAFFRKRQVDEAIFHFQKAVEARPDFADAYANLGTALSFQRRSGEAIADYEKALELAPRSITIRNNLAQLLATCPDLSVRNGSKALQVAQEAVHLSAGKDPVSFRALASAYAENGEFSEAVAAAEKALELAGNDNSLVDAIQRELESYRANQRPAH
jgi:Flp pilus assembly protein TadD